MRLPRAEGRRSRFRAMWRKRKTSSICLPKQTKYSAGSIFSSTTPAFIGSRLSRRLLRMSFIGSLMPMFWASFWQRRRQRRQHWLNRDFADAADERSLRGDQGCGEYHYSGVGQGTWAKED